MDNSLFSLGPLAALLLLPFGADALDTTGLVWRTSRFAHLDGHILTVDVPAGHEKEGGNAQADVDLSEFGGKCFTAEIRARGERITEPPEKWNGLKFMFHYTDPRTGEQHWPNTPGRLGDFPEQVIAVVDNTPARSLGKATLTLGLQSSSGKVVFDLSTLRIVQSADLFPRVNDDYRVAYPARVSDLPPLRGVMLPGSDCKEDDFRTLQAWGATLARYQMIRGWGQDNTNQDLDDYDRWLDGRLDHLERDVLPWAKKYGLRLVVDLHVPPGGRQDGEMNMFHDAKWANHFVACWQRIARRFKGRPEIYGFDLINEPQQTQRAPEGLDYWNVQRRAAEAVRAIDPDTPIVLESNGWDCAPAYAYLSPLAMDNVIYQVHMYQPFEFTHQGVHAQNGVYTKTKYPDPARGWNRDFLKRHLAPVLAFQKKHNARIYVGEFSAITWAEGAENYLADCISIFEEYGWDWTYHAFREWPGWSVEHTAKGLRTFEPSADNPRKRALLKGLGYTRTPQATNLLFRATFDGSAVADEARGRVCPVRAEDLLFVDGHRGRALHFAQGSTNRLAYAAKGNLVAARGTFAAWVCTDWADRPKSEWRHVAVTWDENGPQVFFDGRAETDADLCVNGALALTDLLAFPPDPEAFYLGGANGPRTRALSLDDLRLYAITLTPAQIKELARRETVAEITLEKAALFADRTTLLDVKTTSPAGLDLSALRYCIHTKDGQPVVTFRQKIGTNTVKLPVNLPRGDYVLRATDGDWYYGCVPFTVRAADSAPAPKRAETKPLRGLQRFWHDVRSFDFENMRRR